MNIAVTAKDRWLAAWPVTSYVDDRWGQHVRVSQEILKTVVFVGVENNGQFSPVGTGFLIGYPFESYSFNFLATAIHVVDMIASDKIAVRINKKNGDSTIIYVEKTRIINHSDRKNDIALLPVKPDFVIWDQLSINFERDDFKNRHDIWEPDIGDEVVTVGLYGTHFGAARNLPIARIGHISMMPGEPVLTKAGEIPAYLIEVRSIAGLSGSPVYCNVPRFDADGGNVRYLLTPAYVPLGMMLGYHLVATAQDQIQVPNQDGDIPDNLSVDERNTGFAVVVPFERFFELLESDPMKKIFRSSIDDRLKSSKFREAGATPVKTSGIPISIGGDANPSHKEDFTSLLNAAAKTKPQAD